MSETASTTGVLDLRVRDLMQEDVTVARPDMTVRDVARILSDRGITGAPVLDASGALLGVVSTSDIARTAAEEAEARTEGRLAGFFLPEETGAFDPDWGGPEGEGALDELRVEDIMTTVPFTVPPNASVRELADFLVRGQIHRAIVTDGDRLVGIVTTMDVLRAVAESG